MAVNKGMFSCESNEWSTPQELFDELDAEFKFTLDPCCTIDSAKCFKYFTRMDDGISHDWIGESVFMNPPYGREIGKWMEKAYKESLEGALVVCLVPARTDTKWWHDFAMKGNIRFIKGRIKFERMTKAGHLLKGPAPFPSAIVIFNPKTP